MGDLSTLAAEFTTDDELHRRMDEISQPPHVIRYMREVLNPILQPLVAEILRECPDNPRAYLIGRLKKLQQSCKVDLLLLQSEVEQLRAEIKRQSDENAQLRQQLRKSQEANGRPDTAEQMQVPAERNQAKQWPEEDALQTQTQLSTAPKVKTSDGRAATAQLAAPDQETSGRSGIELLVAVMRAGDFRRHFFPQRPHSAKVRGSTVLEPFHFSGMWSYFGGRYALVAEGAQYRYEETRADGNEVKGMLSEEGEWYQGALSIGTKLWGFIRIRPHKSGLVFNLRGESQGVWSEDMIAISGNEELMEWYDATISYEEVTKVQDNMEEFLISKMGINLEAKGLHEYGELLANMDPELLVFSADGVQLEADDVRIMLSDHWPLIVRMGIPKVEAFKDAPRKAQLTRVLHEFLESMKRLQQNWDRTSVIREFLQKGMVHTPEGKDTSLAVLRQLLRMFAPVEIAAFKAVDLIVDSSALVSRAA